ncbi:MAG: ABC transporter permease subunit [candidate division NC10 bacterium]|nr:ABC transporter permease subunit [candidate division NC10 bacterium]
MIPSIPQPAYARRLYAAYVGAFFVTLFAPLAVVAALAFNDSLFPALPWQGFTLDWFLSPGPRRVGLLHNQELLRGIVTSTQVALWVAGLSVAVGTSNAFLFEQEEFPFKQALYALALTPLVIPGVILGISILLFSSTVAGTLERWVGVEVEALRPGLLLVVLGQFSFVATLATLIISARLRKFDRSLEEAALNLGASRAVAIRTVTLRFLRPALLGAAAVAFLMSFENFNTTLFLVGSDATLPITMFVTVRDGSTPVINAVSLLLMVGSAGLGLMAVFSGFEAKRP